MYEVYQSVSGSHMLNKQKYLLVVFFRGDGTGWTREELLSLRDLIAVRPASLLGNAEDRFSPDKAHLEQAAV